MAGSSPPGPPRPPVRVRYYPRRVARPPVAEPLSPGRALHLADDPERAALARHTAEQAVFVGAERPASAAAPGPHAAAHPAPVPLGFWQRVWRRLTGSG